MAQSQRQYECIVFGATGYTGKYTAEHIARSLPTDFKWAVAGRSEGKLRSLVDELKAINPDRTAPGIETAQLEKSSLLSLVKKTKVLITTVGPYHRYGTAVFEACAETGTHYLDVTGEAPWVYDMVQKYDSKAKSTGAIMIPQSGVESAPADLMVWMLASHIQRNLGAGSSSGEIINVFHDVKSAPSGGTMATILTLMDTYSISELAQKTKPWANCPVEPPNSDLPRPLMEKLTGLRTIADLGTLSDNIGGEVDRTMVQRSWGLHEKGKLYGPKFRFSTYMKVRNPLMGFFWHVGLTFALVSLAIPPVRWFLQRFVYQPGQGAAKEETQNDFAEWRAIANAEVADQADPKRVYGRMRWDGSLYDLTGVFLAEAALVLAREQTYAHQLGGGVLTPSTLGEAYLDRLNKVGLKTEIRTLP